jgi:hypothetical protein|tara:strand:- start:100 stop:756 length:657 start_codon:yes stop_codon:yes gene_type:complete
MTKETEINLEQIKPFGPTILKVNIPEQILNALNEYTDKIISNKEKSEKLNHGKNLVADVTQELKIENEFATKCGWANFLAKCTQRWLYKSMGQKITKFEIIQTWIVRQFKNEHNPIHWHGGHLSGAGFLKTPKSWGKHIQDKGQNIYKGGNLNFVHGNHQFLSNSIYEVKPQVGEFFIFPNYLMHTVYPFNGSDEERRSISFNARIDPKIYDVYQRSG